jgi:4-aminobutyrate aminotransferase-like enzyme
MLDRIGQCRFELAGQAEYLRNQLVDIELELADLIAAERVVGRILVEPVRGSSGFHVADELVFQSVAGSVRGSPNRGITLASKPVTAVIRSPAVVTTSSP